MEDESCVDVFALMAGMAVGGDSERIAAGDQMVAPACIRSSTSENSLGEQGDICEDVAKPSAAIWETIGPTSSLVDSLSRQVVRLRSCGFKFPWHCKVCSSNNSKFFASCEMCAGVNTLYRAAVISDGVGCKDECCKAGDHVLLSLARTKGPLEIEACFDFCEAMACEVRDPYGAVPYYRRAFRLWSQLDCALCADGVPTKLRHEADALLEALGLPRENDWSGGTCPILGVHRTDWAHLLREQVETRVPLLQSFDTHGVARYIVEKGVQRIVVMCGAGISTSAGIPDFRSPGSGLYDNLQKYRLAQPEDMFSLHHFRKCPSAFYELVRELWPGNFAPTPCHHFIRLLHDKGLLLRCYTQNIDSLESRAGLPSDKLVAVHGNFDQAHVIDTEPEVLVDIAEFKAALDQGEDAWKELWRRKGGVVKPKIVFFGEAIPDRFCNLHVQDLASCDLLLVLGTSLVVAPFCDLVSKANPLAPRLLINREPAGLCQQLSGGFRFQLDGEGSNWRDVFYKGDVDDGVRALASALGWSSDLEALLAGP